MDLLCSGADYLLHRCGGDEAQGYRDERGESRNDVESLLGAVGTVEDEGARNREHASGHDWEAPVDPLYALLALHDTVLDSI